MLDFTQNNFRFQRVFFQRLRLDRSIICNIVVLECEKKR